MTQCFIKYHKEECCCWITTGLLGGCNCTHYENHDIIVLKGGKKELNK